MTPTDPTEESAGGHVVLGGKYVLGDILGTGGTYTVYEASRLPAASPGAGGDATSDAPTDDEPDTGGAPEPALLVKVLHPHLVDDEAARAALAREITASDRVDHPGVAKVLDTGEDEVAGANVPWVLMRRLPGVLLSDLAAGEGLPWPDALAVVGGLLDALAAVHAAGLVHRDVSPRNVVVDSSVDGSISVGLLDLGLAAPGGGGGDGERVAGSAAYMSPEQAQGKPLDARSDLYSVGALAYFALTGHAPFERSRPADVLRAHVQAPVPAPSARRAAVPAAVDRFVARAMAKNPARRFASAEATGAAVAAQLGTHAPTGGGGTAPLDATGPDQTMPLGQVAADDPHRTALLGAAGAAAAGAAAAAAAAGDEAELQRTRQLGAVDATGAAVDATGAAVDTTGAAAAAPEPPVDEPGQQDGSGRSRWGAFFSSPRRTAIAVTLLVLLVAAGAGAFWTLRDDGGPGPVAPVTNSPSPSPTTTSPEPRETDPPDDQTDEPTSRPEQTEDPAPTETPDPTPTETTTPTEDPTPTETPDPTPTETSTPDPTPTETSTPDPTPTETSTPDPTPTEEPTEPADPEPTGDPGDSTSDTGA